MADKDIRWIQRFQNFEKAFIKLKEAVEVENPNELERNGLVQRFEFTIDLSWKLLKDFLVENGFSFKPAPKDSIRQAQEANYINYGQELIDGLDIRNELSHDYSGKKFEKSEAILRTAVYPALEKLYFFFTDELQSNQMNLFDGNK